MTESTVTEQRDDFKMFLDRILNERYSSKIEINDDGLITHARVNTNEILDSAQLREILDSSEGYNHNVQIARSGAGIKIEFKMKHD